MSGEEGEREGSRKENCFMTQLPFPPSLVPPEKAITPLETAEQSNTVGLPYTNQTKGKTVERRRKLEGRETTLGGLIISSPQGRGKAGPLRSTAECGRRGEEAVLEKQICIYGEERAVWRSFAPSLPRHCLLVLLYTAAEKRGA